MLYTVLKTGRFDAWLKSLVDLDAQDAIIARIVRVQSGLLGDHKSVGDKVGEFRVDVGQGYRLYYTMRGLTIVLLLCGGGKKTQKADIKTAQAMVQELKMAKTMAAKKKDGSR